MIVHHADQGQAEQARQAVDLDPAVLREKLQGIAGALRTMPLPTVQPRPRATSRADRRAKPPTATQLAAAGRAGYSAGINGVDHTRPGACPYRDRALIDAWAKGYTNGKRKREETRQ